LSFSHTSKIKQIRGILLLKWDTLKITLQKFSNMKSETTGTFNVDEETTFLDKLHFWNIVCMYELNYFIVTCMGE
jgi:hypothetical protein